MYSLYVLNRNSTCDLKEPVIIHKKEESKAFAYIISAIGKCKII